MVGVAAPRQDSNDTDGGSTPCTSNLSTILQENFKGLFQVPLKNITCTALVRQVSDRGCKLVMGSIMEKGWLDHCAPAIVVEHDSLPGGVFTESSVPTYEFRVLDGNHRITAAKRLWGGEQRVACRVYTAFAPKLMKIVADQFNDAGESLSQRSFYDRLYCLNELIKQLQHELGVSEISAQAVKDAYSAVGSFSQSVQTLRLWKKCLGGLSEKAFVAIRDVFQSDESELNTGALTLSNMIRPDFLKLKNEPTQQALVVHALARFQYANRTSPTKNDWAGIVKRASFSVELLRCVERSIPREGWVEAFETALDRFTKGYVSTIDFESVVVCHLKAVAAGIEDIRSRFPGEDAALSAYEELARGQLPRRLELIVKKHSRSRDAYDRWTQRFEAAKAALARRTVATPSPSGEKGNKKRQTSSQEDHQPEEDMDNEDEDVCVIVSPPASGRDGDPCAKRAPREDERYPCAHGDPTGTSRCDFPIPKDKDKGASSSAGLTNSLRVQIQASDPGVDGATSQKEDKSGKDSTTQQRKKRKGTLALRIPDSRSELIERVRALNTKIHEGELLVRGSDLHEEEGPLRVVHPPKLIMVAIDAEKRIMSIGNQSSYALHRVMDKIVRTLHPQGTVVFGLPRPWLLHGTRIYDHIAKHPTMVVEDSPLLLQYHTPHGGRIGQATSLHARNTFEAILIVHKVPGEDKETTACTINPRVVASDVLGMSGGGPNPPFLQLVDNLQYPPGAPNGGPRVAFPPKVIQLLVGRFSVPGDTVVGIGVESTQVPEVALDRGRRVELFLAEKDSRESVQSRINEAFLIAFNHGQFKYDISKDVTVGPGNLNRGVPPDTTLASPQREEGRDTEQVSERDELDVGCKLKIHRVDGDEVGCA